MEHLVTHDTFSGTVLVAQDGTPRFQRSYGFAHYGYQIPNHAATKYNVGSLMKMFTALAVMQLVEHGTLHLHVPLSRYLDVLPQPFADTVTLHHLLTHTSGMRESILNEHTFWQYKDQVRTTADWLARVLDAPPTGPPGTAWAYSNAGFVVVGAVIEQMTGQGYFDYVREHIWRPAGMDDTDGYALDEDVAQRALGYMERAAGARADEPRRNNLPWSVIRGSAHGGGYSTVPDLLRFARALRHNQLLSARATTVLLTSKVATGRSATEHYAYGFFVDQVQGHQLIGHGGRVAGFNAWFDLYWEAGYTVVILANYAAPSAQQVGEKLRQVILHDLG